MGMMFIIILLGVTGVLLPLLGAVICIIGVLLPPVLKTVGIMATGLLLIFSLEDPMYMWATMISSLITALIFKLTDEN